MKSFEDMTPEEFADDMTEWVETQGERGKLVMTGINALMEEREGLYKTIKKGMHEFLKGNDVHACHISQVEEAVGVLTDDDTPNEARYYIAKALSVLGIEVRVMQDKEMDA